MLRKLGIVVITGLLAAGCTGTSNTPDRPAPSSCPVSPTLAAGAQQDFMLVDPETCENVSLEKVARTAQQELERSYIIKIVLPGQNYTCTRGGKPAPVDGSATTALGFCDGNKVFVMTAPGVTKRINGTKIVYIWYVVANESAAIRFTDETKQVCAAGYIVGKRDNAAPQADLKALESVKTTSWKKPEAPWRYIAFGYKLAREGKGIEGCDRPQPVAAPSAS